MAAQSEEQETDIAQLKTQLEWYFSPQNLSRDQYLKSKMSSEGYVPISVIAEFKRVKDLTKDLQFLTQQMRECRGLFVDESGQNVRASQPKKAQRTTLMLRDIPNDTPVEQIKEIFNFPECGEIVNYKPQYGDNWFIEFKTEEGCSDAAVAMFDRTFKGKSIRCRIKSAHVQRSFFTETYSQPVSAVWRPGSQQVYGGGYYVAPGYVFGQSQAADENNGKGARGNRKQKPGRKGAMMKNGRSEKGKKARGKKEKGKAAEPSFGPGDFPTLPGQEGQEAPDAEAGFTRESMAAIIEDLIKAGGNVRPESIPAPSDSHFTRDSPLYRTQLNDPFPVIYPASPSPNLAAQAHRSSEIIPFISLDDSMPIPMNQAKVATAVAQAQGFESKSTNKSQKKSRSKSNAQATDADGFSTATGKSRKGGHGHGSNKNSGKNGGHGHGQSRNRRTVSKGNRPTAADIVKSSKSAPGKKTDKPAAKAEVKKAAPSAKEVTKPAPSQSKPAAQTSKPSGQLSFAELLKKKSGN